MSTPTDLIMSTSAPEPAAADVLWANLDREALRTQFASGDLHELEFDAIVFRAQYPNLNFIRFCAEDLPDLATTLVGTPFLRNHNAQDIAARDGTVIACACVPGPDGDNALQARIRLTTQEGIRDFLAGRIDRFSISWFRGGPTECSVCGKDWLHGECRHTPGETYRLGARQVRCEMIQHHPIGREISAVNVPASPGTRVLAELLSFKEQQMEDSITQTTPELAAPADLPALAALSTQVNEVREELEVQSRQWREEADRQKLEQMLVGSGLSAAAQNVVRQVTEPQLGCLDVEAVDKLIHAQQAALAEAVQPQVVTGMHPVTARDMRTGVPDNLKSRQMAGKRS